MEKRDDPGKRLSTREYLTSKFEFIHLRLTKIYKGVAEEPDPAALQESAQAFIEDLPIAVFFSSLQGRFLYCNRRAEELSGYSRKDVVGKLYYQTRFVGLNDLIKLASLYASRAFDHSLGPYRFTLIRRDGRRLRIEVMTRLSAFGLSRIVVSMAREVDESHPAREDEEEEGDLKRRLSQINRGMNPISICMDCKKIQASEDEWVPIEYFLYKQLELEFSHGYCPQCSEKRRTGA